MASTIRELDHLRIPLEEIINATNNFADENIIGKGGLGNVYKGQLMRSGKSLNVSVRRFDGRQRNVEFLTEISTLASLKYQHAYLVSMIGFCEERGEKIIINNYQAKGSLMMHLTNTTSFTWLQRMKLSVEVAEAISYLHCGTEKRVVEDLLSIYARGLCNLEESLLKPFLSRGKLWNNYLIIHRNINSSTILLDEYMSPRLSGFEYSIQHSVDRKDHIHLCEAIGTRGYMDPTIVKNSGVNHKSDVYSFGVVLFEILCGRKANQDNKLLIPLVKYHYEHGTMKDIILPGLWKQMDQISFKVFSEVAYSCLEREWTQRPDINQVLEKLKKVQAHDYTEDEENSKDAKSGLPIYKKNLEDKTTTWEEQLEMCIDNANELNYLHNEMEVQKTVIHDDTNSGNIVLDDNSLDEKIVGYRHLVFHSEVFMDPGAGLPCKESDVFGFGVHMFEMLCGQDASKLVKLVGLKNKEMASMVRTLFNSGVLLGGNGDTKLFLNKGPNEDSLDTFIKIACRCVEKKRNERPTMKVVVHELQKALDFQKNYKDNFRMSFEDIKLATQNFSPANVIGGGGFGKVYKGKLAHKNGNGYIPIVAKKLDTRHGQGNKEFYTELQILCEYKHENIIGLVGYSNETDEKIIVYEHASKGSLDKYLSDTNLTWWNRLQICIDFAKGLDFLQGDTQKKHAAVIHRDIKSSNILLFDDWKAKVGDFGLSMISATQLYTIDFVCGTPGYVDPLYLKSGLLTKESDIYSFGVALFEILCGKAIYEIHTHASQSLLSFIEQNCEEGKRDDWVFKGIKEEIVPNSFATFLNIVYRCLHDDRERRPSSKEVFQQLIRAWNIQVRGSSLKMLLDDIKTATQNFSLANEIKRGNFESVYKGEYANEDGKRKYTKVVAKKFDRNSQGKKQFYNEFQIVYEYKHEHIISLVGYVNETDEKIIVYEYASKGSLDKYLNDASLTWTDRLKICIDFAIGLNFLHERVDGKEVVIHRNIKSSNILLFDDWKVKMGGFGLSCKISKNTKCSTIDLASGYVDPQYLLSGRLTKESDIYSFGVVLFEIMCGKVVYEIDKHEGESLLSFIKHKFQKGVKQLDDDVVFKCMKKEIGSKSLTKFLNILCECLDDDPKKRPSSKEVLRELRSAFQSQEDYDHGCCLVFVEWLMNCEI